MEVTARSGEIHKTVGVLPGGRGFPQEIVDLLRYVLRSQIVCLRGRRIHMKVDFHRRKWILHLEGTEQVLHLRVAKRLRRFLRNAIQEQELIAGIPEGLRCLTGAYADDLDAGFPEPNGQRCVVAVAGDDGEGVVFMAVQQVHGVDGQSHVRGVFADGAVELLCGLDIPQKHISKGGSSSFAEVLCPIQRLRPMKRNSQSFVLRFLTFP